jgi:GT2 family glycosyltransferase
MPKYSIIVPVLNQLKYTQDCVNSIIAMSQDYDYEIVIVANGCTDKTEEWVLNLENKSIVLCSYKEPLGAGKAINTGIRLSRGEYLIVLNNDCVILGQPWIGLLEEPFIREPKMGVTGPLLYLSDITKMTFLVFFCVMIHRKVIDKIGLLDDVTFPIGAGEDTDFCARAQEAGFLIEQVPNNPLVQNSKYMVGVFPIYHAGEGTVGTIPNWNEIFKNSGEALKKKYARRIEK